MLDYREQSGINPNFLSAQENDEDQYKRTIFHEIFKETIETLLLQVDEQDTTNILNSKRQIREAILRFPYCDESEQYAVWLDSINSQFCEKLINNCKKEITAYNNIRANIYSSLGSSSYQLPDSSIDALTSAELLYSKYANDSFANLGFDFSCISALYYQAFENAYNALFWHHYADFLNNLMIGSERYTDILSRFGRVPNSNGIASQAMGYLDNITKTRSFYVNYNPTEVKSHCMYKSFGILMSNIVQNTHLTKLCSYYASFVGFNNLIEMFTDTDYMNKCSSFSSAIISSADNRNNASHGGSLISLHQCKTDKKTVINDLEKVKNDCIGLIQQLLYLLYSHKN